MGRKADGYTVGLAVFGIVLAIAVTAVHLLHHPISLYILGMNGLIAAFAISYLISVRRDLFGSETGGGKSSYGQR